MAFDPTSHLFAEMRTLSERLKRLEDRGVARSGQIKTLAQAVEAIAKRLESLEALRERLVSYAQKCALALPAVAIIGANASMGQITETLLQVAVKLLEALK